MDADPGSHGNQGCDDAFLEEKNLCESNSFIGVAAAVWIVPHTFLEVLAAGRPDAGDKTDGAICGPGEVRPLRRQRKPRPDSEWRYAIQGCHGNAVPLCVWHVPETPRSN